MKQFFAYFGFTQTERRGFSVLVFLTFLITIAPAIYNHLKQDHVVEYAVAYFSDVDTGVPETEAAEELYTSANMGRREKHAPVSYFEFDPNGLSVADWRRLGFSPRQVAVIKNYEAKGGRFYKKEDVAKIYSISREEYERIAPYIVIKNTKDRHVEPRADRREEGYKTAMVPGRPININEADTSMFKKLKGIGPVLSSRIVRYRDALGGFYVVSQIGEVYGISPEVFESIRPLLAVESSDVRKLNCNTATREQLSRHPYISTKQASLIVNYRLQHGAFSGLEDLKKISVLDDDFFRKIEAYIEF